MRILLLSLSVLFSLQLPSAFYRLASSIQRPPVNGSTVLSLPNGSSPSAFREIVRIGALNKLPIGIVVDVDHKICEVPLDIRSENITIDTLVATISHKIPGYAASLQGNSLNIYPLPLPTQTAHLMDLQIPEFHSRANSHQGLGVNLWMFIRALVAPGEGTAFVGGSSTTQETVPALKVTDQSVRTILNTIVAEGSGGVWVMQTLKGEQISDQTATPYEIFGYAGDERLEKTSACE